MGPTAGGWCRTWSWTSISAARNRPTPQNSQRAQIIQHRSNAGIAGTQERLTAPQLAFTPQQFHLHRLARLLPGLREEGLLQGSEPSIGGAHEIGF
jgi:hypothetical protein